MNYDYKTDYGVELFFEERKFDRKWEVVTCDHNIGPDTWVHIGVGDTVLSALGSIPYPVAVEMFSADDVQRLNHELG